MKEKNLPVAHLPPMIDTTNEHYPFCVVWSPIPLLTWVIPFIGHIGICDSAGRKYDFQGSYSIGEDRMLFSNPVKYWDVSRQYIPSFYASFDDPSITPNAEDIRKEIQAYDEGLHQVITKFRQTQTYNLFTNNCHAFVASSMNVQQYTKGHSNAATVCLGMFFYGTYVSWRHFMAATLPFFLLVTIIVVLVTTIA